MSKPLLQRPWHAAVAAVVFIAIAVLRLPLLSTMMLLTPLSVLVTWKAAR